MKYIPIITTISVMELAFFAGVLNRDERIVAFIMMAISAWLAGWIAARVPE